MESEKTSLSPEVLYFFQEIKDLYRETERFMKEQSLETDRRFKETDRRFKETDKKIGKLTNRLGEFIEEMVRPSVVRLLRERGIAVHSVSRNVYVERAGESAEFDLLVVNDGEMVAVECKSSLSIDDVNEHLERLGKIKRLLPHYANMRVMGAVAAMVIQENVARYAFKKGLFVMGQSGEAMKILNSEQFRPHLW